MLLALVLCIVYGSLVWYVCFRRRWFRFTIGLGIFSTFFVIHVLLIIMIGLRFVTPYSETATVVQPTIQLVPRLPEPTLVTAVLVEPNVPVKKGQPLFQFDRRPYEFKVQSARAQLAAAEQHVLELKAQLEAATSKVGQARGQRNGLKAALDASAADVVNAKAKCDLARATLNIADAVARTDAGAISKLRLDQDRDGLRQAEAAVQVAVANEAQARVTYEETAEKAVAVALAEEKKARLAYESQIDGENTSVARLKAELAMDLYYLDNTTMVAPDDGTVINLQVRAGMVAGVVRVGAIATFVVDADRYVLATYFQENLKYVQEGQPTEVVLDRYPGQVFSGKVKSVWPGTGGGQYLPSGELPKFEAPAPKVPQGCFAVQIVLDDPNQSQFPIGAQGNAAIYTSDGKWMALRKIDVRSRTWLNWLYPMPF